MSVLTVQGFLDVLQINCRTRVRNRRKATVTKSFNDIITTFVLQYRILEEHGFSIVPINIYHAT